MGESFFQNPRSGFYQRRLLHRQRNRGGDVRGSGSLYFSLVASKVTGIGGGADRCVGVLPRPRRRRRRRFQPQPERRRRRRHVGTTWRTAAAAAAVGPARTLFQGDSTLSSLSAGPRTHGRGRRRREDGDSPKSHGCSYVVTPTFAHEVAVKGMLTYTGLQCRVEHWKWNYPRFGASPTIKVALNHKSNSISGVQLCVVTQYRVN